MKLTSTVVTLSLSALAFAPAAAAQWHPEHTNFDRGRPDVESARPDRMAFTHPIVGTERSRDVAPRSQEVATQRNEAPPVGLVGRAAIERVLDRSSNGGNDGEGNSASNASHANAATQSPNIAGASTAATQAPSGGMGAHMAIQRVMERTAVGGDSDDGPGPASANTHEHAAMQSSNIQSQQAQSAGPQAQHLGMAGRAAIQRVMERTASGGGEEGGGGSSADSHVNVAMQSINISAVRGAPAPSVSTTLATEVIRVRVRTTEPTTATQNNTSVQRSGHPD